MSLLYVSVNISRRKPPKCQTGTRHGLTALREKITLLYGSFPSGVMATTHTDVHATLTYEGESEASISFLPVHVILTIECPI